MAFQNLRAGNTVYIFYKTADPVIKVGQIIGDVKLRPKYPTSNGQPVNFGAMPYTPEQVADFSVKTDERIQPFENVNPASDIQDCGNGMIISCSRDAINAEVTDYMRTSEKAVNEETIEMHRNIISKCTEILAEVNPEIAERKRVEVENAELRKELSEVKNMVKSLLEQLGSSK